MERTHIIDTPNKVGETVRLNGWAKTLRATSDKLTFIDLRDATGYVQVVGYKPDLDEETVAVLDQVKTEYVLEIEGVVQARGAKQVNDKIPTGTVEIGIKKITILNTCETPPFEVDKDTGGVNEELRLKYRYLDLRSERMQKNLRLRSQFMQAVRKFLVEKKFVEIETPLLTKATPEGSRDFVVPSRLQPGKFFALPQSPQQYKQLLMAAGFERYFQMARALRDEDLRADRAFEHTQVDIEMSFVERDEFIEMMEEMIIEVVETLGLQIKEKPFPRFTYKEAIDQFGDDHIDLRTEEDKEAGIMAFCWVLDFPMFEKTDDGKWTFTHNPFSNPLPEFKEDLLAGKNVENIIAAQYDLMCNGTEAGGGSIRAHEAEVLEATYKVMGYSADEIQESIGHMLEAFKFGAPPHGGIAFGVDRFLMDLAHEQAIREVIAFPMTSSGNTAVMDGPSELSDTVLDDLNIQIKKD